MATSTTSTTSGMAVQGSRTYFFGQASGIDTSALVEAAYQAKIAKATKLTDQITKNTNKSTALSKLQTLAQDVSSKLSSMRKNYSFLSSTSSAFDMRTGSLQSSVSTVDPTSVLSVGIDPKTALGSFDIEVTQKAKAHRVISDVQSDASTALGYTGTFDLGLAGGTSGTINVNSTMTLNDVADAINAQASTTGVGASVIKVSGTSYQLVLSGAQTGKDISVSNVTGTNVMDSLGVTASGAFKTVLQTADKAILKLDGVTVTRDSNAIDDLITGVHLTINSQSPGTHITMNVTNDTSTIKSNIESFVTSYNALRDFVLSNQTLQSDGTVSSDAVLFSDFQLRSMSEQIQGVLGGRYGASGATYATLADMGIALDSNNKLTVDETKLDTALSSKLQEVRSFFETQNTSSDSNFAMLKNKSTTLSGSYTFDITMSGSSISSVNVNGTSGMFTVSGNTIQGVAGTPYEGMSFGYIGTASTSLTFTMNQGLADILDNTMSKFSDIVTGSLQQEKISLDDQNTQLQNRADDITARADAYRSNLIDKYAKFESRISAAKTVLAQLKALQSTSSSSSG